ncbi:hypothetical protein EUGRSUZ_C01460 [Eucalyptus grandis]|uniref:Uncharacterized protein n=2 Tax=Eucalyptus grandis TaxID=71139 RepID=A0A059CNU1_EUCGR|nr:hypothetical protein EUGRSUZ_C01460 [Eucalyptus grandis]
MRAWVGVDGRSAVPPQTAVQHSAAQCQHLCMAAIFSDWDRILFYIIAYSSLPFLYFSSSCPLLFTAII